MGDIRERVVRMRTILGARAVFNDGRSTLDCTIRNMSSTGAKLTFVSTVGLPDVFVLEIPSQGRTIKAVVRWRSETNAGVHFPAGAV